MLPLGCVQLSQCALLHCLPDGAPVVLLLLVPTSMCPLMDPPCRFTIQGNRISYMGWEASVGIRSSAGIRVSDVRFKGERVVYEMALQQAASGEPHQGLGLARACSSIVHLQCGSSVHTLVFTQ